MKDHFRRDSKNQLVDAYQDPHPGMYNDMSLHKQGLEDY
jgi:hypothetical protein